MATIKIADAHVMELPSVTATVLSFDHKPPARWKGLVVDGTEYRPAFMSGIPLDKVAIMGEHRIAGKPVEFV